MVSHVTGTPSVVAWKAALVAGGAAVWRACYAGLSRPSAVGFSTVKCWACGHAMLGGRARPESCATCGLVRRKQANALHTMGALSTRCPSGRVLGRALFVVVFCSWRPRWCSAHKLGSVAHSMPA